MEQQYIYKNGGKRYKVVEKVTYGDGEIELILEEATDDKREHNAERS